MSAIPDVSIIILNYKTRGLLRQCLRGIASSGDTVQSQIIVVDNASGDGSVEMMERDFPGVKLIASAENNGFAAGINLGLRHAIGRYVVLLNTDIAIMEQPFDRLVQFMNQHPRVGMAAQAIKPRWLGSRFLLPIPKRIHATLPSHPTREAAGYSGTITGPT